MRTFEISNANSGHILGTFSGSTRRASRLRSLGRLKDGADLEDRSQQVGGGRW